jgi:anhydro-N-acetylmuramic acid kinase
MTGDAPLYLGLISGTSADAIDAALVSFDGRPQVVAARAFAYPADVRGEILALSTSAGTVSLDALGRLDARIGRAFADAATELIEHCGIERARVRAIGSHGQTVRHRPRGEPPFTMQIGDPNVIAERTGIATVADFRRRDVAAGGEGAPLAPAFHAAALRAAGEDRAILNLGGIANLTLLPADEAAPVIGFDTGPANCLLDAWAASHLGAARDEGGAIAATGAPDPAVLSRCLAERYFAEKPPKSTGREEFDLQWLGAFGLAADAPTALATLTELTAVSIAHAVRDHAPSTRRVIACGGGVHNGFLMARIAAALDGIPLESSDAHGIDPDFVEAALFAWLAHAHVTGAAGNLPSVTGARGPRVLGALHPP